MEAFSALLAICAGNSPAPGEFPAQRPVTRSFDVLICVWMNGWVNNREAGDLGRYSAHYDVIVIGNSQFIHYQRNYGIFGKRDRNTQIWHFDFLEIAWHQPHTSIVISMQLSHALLWTKNGNLQCPKVKIHNKIFRNMSFLILFLKSPTTSKVSTIILRIYKKCVYSVIHNWHDANFTTVRRITILVLKQNGRKVLLKVQYLVIGCPKENLLHLYELYLLKFSTSLFFNFSKNDL